MIITLNELKTAISALTDSDTDTTHIVAALTDMARDMEENNRVEADLIDRGHYFVSILWQREDVVNAFEIESIEPTDDLVNEIICDRETADAMDERGTEAGWYALCYGIRNLQRRKNVADGSRGKV